MTTGEKIREVRKAAGLTQKKLGELCGIAEPTIRRYELGKLNPKLGTLNKIANALGTDLKNLFSDDSLNKLEGKTITVGKLTNDGMVWQEVDAVKAVTDALNKPSKERPKRLDPITQAIVGELSGTDDDLKREVLEFVRFKLSKQK